MHVLATFDGSASSEVVFAQLKWLARMPGVRFTFLAIAHPPQGAVRTPAPAPRATGVAGLAGTPLAVAAPSAQPAERRGAAIDRTLAEWSDYLHGIVARMPAGPSYAVEAVISEHVTSAIIRYAMEHRVDMIVMGTHGEAGMIHRLFGDTAECVVRSGVAPVLLVHSPVAHFE